MEEKNMSETTMLETLTEGNIDSSKPEDNSNGDGGNTPKPTNNNDKLNEIKGFVDKNKKTVIAGVIGVVVVLCAIVFLLNRPKKLSNDLEVSFSGYDGYGTLTYNSAELDAKATDAAFRAAGFSAKELSDAEAGIGTASNFSQKYMQALQIRGMISYKFDRYDQLKNGDKVVFTVSCTGSKCPFANEKREYEVKGLDAVEEVSADELQKEYPITFKGYNNYGSPVYDDTIYDINSNLEDTLSNDSTVKVKVLSSAIDTLAQSGKVLADGASEFEVTVSGLPEINTISGISDLYDKANTYMLTQIKDNETYSGKNTYTVEKQGDYIRFTTSYSDDSDGIISVRTVYKVTKSFESTSSYVESSTETYYTYFGCERITVADGKAIQKDLNYRTTTSYSNYENLDSIEVELKNDGFSAYQE